MSRNNIIYVLVGTVIIIILFYSFLGSGAQDNYIQEILDKRAEIDQFMRLSEESPFKRTEEPYQGLKYFEPDPSYRIVADFNPIENGEVRTLPTSDGLQQKYKEYGFADFKLNGRKHRLLVLMAEDDDHIFLPFADSTSGAETYGAGRYLEITSIRDGKIVVDFNLAYNPYCAYSADYSCPLPPAENYLATSVKAGEKNYD